MADMTSMYICSFTIYVPLFALLEIHTLKHQRLFEIVDEFKYLGSTVNSTNNIRKKIRHQILLGNKCHFSSINVLKAKNLSRATKCKLYKMVICPVATYCAETWAINKSAEETLIPLEIKVLKKIFRPVIEYNQWQIRMNVEHENLYKDINIGTFVKLQHLR
jgi:hypothetical protein